MTGTVEAYCYNHDTLEYTGIGIAYESPVDPGTYFYPADSVSYAPPPYDPALQSCKFIDGVWTLADLPPPPVEEPPTDENSPAYKEHVLRDGREMILSSTDWMLTRHHDELLLNIPHRLDESQLSALLTYRQALRDMTLDPAFPNIDLPTL